jgi:hypothetical protein
MAMKTALALFLLAFSLVAQPKKKSEPFWAKVLRFAGVSATPSSLRGGEKAASGDVWVAAAAPKPMLQRLTLNGGYNSPVFDSQDQSVFALKDGDFYRIPLKDDAPTKVRSLTGVSKLVGISRDDADLLLVVTKDSQGAFGAALLSIKTGAIAAIPHEPQSKEDEMMLAHLAGWERVFGDVRLYCEDNEKEAAGGTTIRFTDVYLKLGRDPSINLTNGSGVSSCQPSLSSDGKLVVFIRATR